MKPQRNPGLNYQRGAVLVVGLLLLIVMTVLGISSLKTVTLEERMSANVYDRSLAFQAAEAALRAGEKKALLQSQKIPPNGDFPNYGKGPSCQCSDGLCTQECENAWDDKNFKNWAEVSSLSGISGTPKYVVEFIGDGFPCDPMDPINNRNCSIYRITASSHPGPDRAQVILQSLYLAP